MKFIDSLIHQLLIDETIDQLIMNEFACFVKFVECDLGGSRVDGWDPNRHDEALEKERTRTNKTS